MNKKWKNISELVCDAFGHYWIYDTNEGVIEGYWDADHRKMTDRNGKQLFAVTHFKNYYIPDDPDTEIRNNSISTGIVDFLINESDDILADQGAWVYTEFRLVVNSNGHCYAHVLGRSSETYDFDLPNKIKYDRTKKLNILNEKS